LFVAVTVCAIAIGWVFNTVRERRLVRATLEARGVIFMDYEEWQTFRKGRWTFFTDSKLPPPVKYRSMLGDRGVGMCWVPFGERYNEKNVLLQKHFPEAHRVSFIQPAVGEDPFVPDNSW